VNLTNLFLARHGQTEYNRLNQIQGRGIDASLNETGHRQAHAIARHLKDSELHRVYSSSLKRSQETATVVCQLRGLTLESHADMDEMDFGKLEGRPISEIRSQLKELHNNWKAGNTSFALQGAESPEIVRNRAAGKIEQIIAEQQGNNLLFVLHGRLIRILVSHWLEYGLSQMHRVPHTNGAVYHLQWDGQLFEPIYLNHTDHLSNGEQLNG